MIGKRHDSFVKVERPRCSFCKGFILVFFARCQACGVRRSEFDCHQRLVADVVGKCTLTGIQTDVRLPSGEYVVAPLFLIAMTHGWIAPDYQIVDDSPINDLRRRPSDVPITESDIGIIETRAPNSIRPRSKRLVRKILKRPSAFIQRLTVTSHCGLSDALFELGGLTDRIMRLHWKRPDEAECDDVTLMCRSVESVFRQLLGSPRPYSGATEPDVRIERIAMKPDQDSVVGEILRIDLLLRTLEALE